MSTWWKVYFWIIAAQVVGTPIAAIHTSDLTVKDLIDWVFVVVGVTGLFGFVYNKHIGDKRLWKVFLPVFIAWDVFIRLISPSYSESNPELSYYIAAILLFAILVPQYIALYRYGYRNSEAS